MVTKAKDLTKLSLPDFYEFSLSELRDVAAFLGVLSPTSKSKGVLAKEAYDAKCSAPIIEDKKGRGRPTKAAKNNYYIDREKLKTAQDAIEENASNYLYVNDNFDDGFEFVMSPENYNSSVIQPTESSMNLYEGRLEIMKEGYGFIRANNYKNSRGDVYVNAKVIKKYGLRKYDYIVALGKNQFEDKPASVYLVNSVNGLDLESIHNRPHFASLNSIYPNSKYNLSTGSQDISNRIIDAVCPIGKGQRVSIVAPHLTGKTTLLRGIANALKANYSKTIVYLVLVGERPEEVVYMQSVTEAPIAFSTFDEMPSKHIKVAEVTLEIAKREVEYGHDVVVIFDSMTNIVKAYNSIANKGRISSEVNCEAIVNAKKLFSSAKNTAGNGSLTIIATFDIGTGDAMDEMIYGEFSSVSNMKMQLSSTCSNLRVYPAIDIKSSITTRDDLLFSEEEMQTNLAIKSIVTDSIVDSTRDVIRLFSETSCNEELYDIIINKG